MTDQCTIGPVTIENASLLDSNVFDFKNSANQTVTSGPTILSKGVYEEELEFEVICTLDEALQLRGLVEQGEVVWMDTSTDLTDNDYFKHKGWVLLTALTYDYENPSLALCKISYIMISEHEKEYLNMTYSRGIYDGVNIDTSYDPTYQIDYLTEDGSDATTNWSQGSGTNAKVYPSGTNSKWSSDGSALELLCDSATANKWAYTWVYCDQDLKSKGGKFTPPFTLETEVDTLTAPGAGRAGIVGIGITPKLYANLDKRIATKALTQYLNMKTTRTNTSRYISIDVTLTTGKTAQLLKQTSVSTSGNVAWKAQFYYNGYVRISTNVNGAGWVQRYYGPSNIPDYKSGLHLHITNDHNSTAGYTAEIEYVNIYGNASMNFPNIVPLPVGATPITAVTSTRTSEDGTIYYAEDPTSSLPFQMDDVDNLYKGSVKLLSTNNGSSTSRQVFGTDIKLTPTTTTLKNGLTQLTFDADEVILSGYYGGAWNEINRFDMGTSIDIIRPLRITPNIVILQINATKWTMIRGSPIVKVDHPNTTIGYVIKDKYDHDGTTTTSPAADADITMEDTALGYHCEVYPTAATKRLIIVKKNECTIKSDSLPADSLTGLGWVDSTGTGINTIVNVALQFYKQTRTGISLQQIV